MKKLVAIIRLGSTWYFFRPTGICGRGHQPEIEAATEAAALATLNLFNVGPVTIHRINDEGPYVVAHVTFHRESQTLVDNDTLQPITNASAVIRDTISPMLVDIAHANRTLTGDDILAAMNRHPQEDEVPAALAEFGLA